MGELLVFGAGMAAGAIGVAFMLWLTMRFSEGVAAPILIGIASSLAGAYFSFYLVERYVSHFIVATWEAQGHTDNGPSAFIAVMSLYMPFAAGILAGGILTTLTVAMRRAPK